MGKRMAFSILLAILLPVPAFPLNDQHYEGSLEKISAVALEALKTKSLRKLDYYPVPLDLKMRLVRQSAVREGFQYFYKGIFEVLIGKPSKVKIFFECTPDFSVEAKPVFFKTIGEGEKKEFLIPVRKGPGKAPFGKTWVRMRVKYLPYYDAILKKISSEKEKYPALGLYTRLLREIRTLKAGKRVVNTGISVFPKEEDALQRILDEKF